MPGPRGDDTLPPNRYDGKSEIRQAQSGMKGAEAGAIPDNPPRPLDSLKPTFQSQGIAQAAAGAARTQLKFLAGGPIKRWQHFS
jgi:hypothetical protein